MTKEGLSPSGVAAPAGPLANTGGPLADTKRASEMGGTLDVTLIDTVGDRIVSG